MRRQHRLLGQQATLRRVRETILRRVRETITDSAARAGPDRLMVLTLSGHSERPVPGDHHGGWCLRDGTLHHTETVELLAAAPPSAHIVVITDTCYAAAFADVFADAPATTVLLAACARSQTMLNYPVSEFVSRLERPTFPEGTPTCAPTTRRRCDSAHFTRQAGRWSALPRPSKTGQPRAKA